ncbi:hypothetical protein ACFU51_09125 [Streptomyces sp. NPDC057430]|uniref:hypothetical protein n=1 Tax=Streptomyces sp. NPDC057430 TaxID=3346131 RepID=UPI00369EB18C
MPVVPAKNVAEMWVTPSAVLAEDAHLWREGQRQRELEERRARLQEKAAQKRAGIDRKNAVSRRAALERAATAQADARRANLGPAGAR